MGVTRLSQRIIARLAQAEACEPNLHYRDDLQIAKLTVLYASTGEAVYCAPHVLATYNVLGCHPDKVWSKIERQREALGDPEKVSGGSLPPKKPPQSAVGFSHVKLWCENTNATKTVNLRGANAAVLREPAISVPMASRPLAAVYPNSDHAGSRKERPFFKREELQEFFETCPSDLVSHPELRTLHGMWIAAGKPFGSEIQFFKAMKHYCVGAPNGGYRSESTVRANIRRAEDSGALEVAYRGRRGECHHIWIRPRTDKDPGLYRRVTTYRLSIPMLLKWRHRRGGEPQSNVEPIRKPAQHAPDKEATAKTAERSDSREPLRITRDVRIAIAGCYTNARKQGHAEDAAVAEVVKSLSTETHCLSESEVRLQLKIWQSKHGSLDPPQARERIEPARCEMCRTVLVQNRGPGPRLICPQCRKTGS